MDEKDLKHIAATVDWLASVGQRKLARTVTFQALLELKRMKPEEKPESVREIEAALKKTYAGDGMMKEASEFRPKSGYVNILFETALKTATVLAVIFVVFTVVGFVTNIGDKHYKMITKIEKGHDRKWNQIEGALSRNPYLYYRAALLYEERDEFDKAVFQMEKAVSLAPGDERYTRKLAELYTLLKEQKKARRDTN